MRSGVPERVRAESGKVSPKAEGYFPDTSPVTPQHLRNLPKSPETLVHGSLLPEAPRSLDSFVGSPVISMSLTEHAADLSLLPDPLITLQDEILLLGLLPMPMRPQSSLVRQSPGKSLASELSREGPFDACCEPSDTGRHLFITKGLPGCPNRMTSYWVEEVADIDPAFGVQLHHLRFLKCIGAQSARLLGHSPAEWVRSMDRQDVMAMALELQRDASLMASNLQVLDQYVMSLNRMSSEVLSLRTRSLPGARGQRRSPGAPGALRGHPDGSHGIVAATDGPGCSRADHGVILQ